MQENQKVKVLNWDCDTILSLTLHFLENMDLQMQYYPIIPRRNRIFRAIISPLRPSIPSVSEPDIFMNSDRKHFWIKPESTCNTPVPEKYTGRKITNFTNHFLDCSMEASPFIKEILVWNYGEKTY